MSIDSGAGFTILADIVSRSRYTAAICIYAKSTLCHSAQNDHTLSEAISFRIEYCMRHFRMEMFNHRNNPIIPLPRGCIPYSTRKPARGMNLDKNLERMAFEQRCALRIPLKSESAWCRIISVVRIARRERTTRFFFFFFFPTKYGLSRC